MTSQDIEIKMLNSHIEKLERDLAFTRAEIAELKSLVQKNNSEIKAEVAKVGFKFDAQKEIIKTFFHINFWVIGVIVILFFARKSRN